MTNIALRIKNPPQYGVIWDDPEKISESIYCSIYSDALRNVYDIIYANEKDASEDLLISPERFNTSIAFVGKRGSGKSTAMCNFANILSKISESSDLSWVNNNSLGEDNLNKIKKGKYHVLNVIDSAQLGVKETIIGRISAAMYSKYKKITQSNAPQLSAEKKRSFIGKLSEVNKYAVMYQTGEWFENRESLLVDTYNVSSLRQKTEELTSAYLRLITGKDRIKNEYLVVSIDDLDMGIENSYLIMEEIRKFLCIPNVIVLVTLRMDQVHTTLKGKFEHQIEGELEATDKLLLKDLAYRYSEKLFPYDRQHHMPILTTDMLRSVRIVFEPSYAETEKYSTSVLGGILYLIWKKTGIILLCDIHNDHVLIPRNLRSLCHLVAFFQKLPDVNYKELRDAVSEEKSTGGVKFHLVNAQETLKNNIREFYQYLIANLRSFEYEYISKEDERFAGILISIIHNIDHIPLAQLNSYIVGEILYYLNNHKDVYYFSLFSDPAIPPELTMSDAPKDPENTRIMILLQACKHYEIISLGDLMYVLGKIDNKTRCRYIRYLIEIIRTLWSAKITEEYFTAPDRDKTTYRDVIGNLIVNPDVGFFKNTISDMYTPNKIIKLNPIFYVTDTVKGDVNWREHRLHKRESDVKQISHPLAPLTHKNYINYLPFYSFDFTYRFYEELHKKIGDETQFEWKAVNIYRQNGALMQALMDMSIGDDSWIFSEGIIKLSELEEKSIEIRSLINTVMPISSFKDLLSQCNTYIDMRRLMNKTNQFDIDLMKVKKIKELTENMKDDSAVPLIKNKIIEILDSEKT